MDRRERMKSDLVALNAAIRGERADIWTALPGILQSFDAAKMTCVVRPAIQAQLRQSDGTWIDANLPLLLDCPVIFPAGGGFALTFPLAAGDEGLVIFASRCIDSWWQSGGIQKQAELRMHDLSDGFFLPGCFSQPRKLANVNTAFPELRNADGSIKFEVTATGFKVTGDLDVTGEVSRGVGGADVVTLGSHIHPANNQPPTPGL
jgi:hypothetical protein